MIVTEMSIRFYTVNLTRSDSRMKVSLKGLPNTLRGGAWPSSACVVRCPVKSGNKRDLCVQLLLGKRAHCTDCSSNGEEGAVNVR